MEKEALLQIALAKALGGGGGGGTGPAPYTSNPAALGEASPGESNSYARGDHVHPKPSPADIGAGTYSMPNGGIPKTDLANDVQASLGKEVHVGSTQPTDPSVEIWVDTSINEDPEVRSATILTIWTGTQAQYDAISQKSNTTLYFIEEEGA